MNKTIVCAVAALFFAPTAAVAGLAGRTASLFDRIDAGNARTGANVRFALSAWRGERVHAQGVVWSDVDEGRLAASATDLVSSDGATIAAANCRAHRLGYETVADARALLCGETRFADRMIPVAEGTALAANENAVLHLTVFTPSGTKPGLYRGTLEVLSDQGAVGTVAVAYRILPFELPQPASYEDLSRRYMSDVNGVRMPNSPRTYAERLAYYKDLAKNCLEHNAEHLGGSWGCASVGKVTKELGFNTDYLFEANNATSRALGIGQGDWRDLYKSMETSPDWQQAIADVPDDPQPGRASGTPAYWKLLGSQHKEAAIAVLMKLVNARVQELKEFDPNGTPMAIFWSESAAYVRLADIQRQQAEVAHRLGWKVFAHGGGPNANFASDVQDMNSAAGNMNRQTAEKWHAGGGSIFSYCYPFPSSENPAMFRRWNGLERYKTFRYDGSMQHGLVTSMYDEFRDDPGGDGNYRNFAVAYRQQLGLAWTIAWEGWREAYDDVRYATLLQQLCKPHLQDADLGVRGEARRCLIWLDSIDGTYTDMNMFRAGVTHRILNFLKIENGKLKMENGKM